MAHVYPVPLPCELCPYGKQCNVPEDKRNDCKLKTEESADFVDWKVNTDCSKHRFIEKNKH